MAVFVYGIGWEHFKKKGKKKKKKKKATTNPPLRNYKRVIDR
jgi:hypothetical protein